MSPGCHSDTDASPGCHGERVMSHGSNGCHAGKVCVSWLSWRELCLMVFMVAELSHGFHG